MLDRNQFDVQYKEQNMSNSGGQEKFASNLIFDFLMKTELF